MDPSIAARISQEARELHEAALILDLHCDLLLSSGLIGWDWGKRHRPNPLPGALLLGHCDLPRLRDGGVGAMALGIVVNPLLGPWRGAHGDRIFERLERKLRLHSDALELARSPQGILSARARGKIACFAGLEGAHALMGSLDRLERWRAQGLGYVGFAHFTANEACRPMVGLGANAVQGLSEFGRALQDESHRLGLVVDVAHINRAGLLEVCKRAQAPILCSHTACTAVQPSPRGLDDEQLKAIADTDGAIGIIFVSPFIGRGGIPRVVEHLNHMRRTLGARHLALGTDWEGFAAYPADLDSAEKLPLLTQALLEAGWGAEEILAFWGGNALRVLGEAQARGVTQKPGTSSP